MRENQRLKADLDDAQQHVQSLELAAESSQEEHAAQIREREREIGSVPTPKDMAQC